MSGKAFWNKFPEGIFENFETTRVLPESDFKIFKNHKGDLSQKLPKPKMWLVVHHTKPTNTLYWN